MARGTFIAVVGPSGAGKDTLIRSAMEKRPDLIIARRVITRPPSDAETSEFITESDFQTRSRAGGFALSWTAHGLSYGIPTSIESDLTQGRHVLVNLSRGVIDQARRIFDPFQVLVITAPPAILAKRLAARGREDTADIAARLDRAAYTAPTGPDVTRIENAGDLNIATAALLAALPAKFS